MLFGNAPGHPRALIEMYSGLNVDFMSANTKSILQSINQKVTLIFNSQYLKSTFHKAIAAIDCNSSDRTGKNKLKDFWTEFSNLDAICNVCDSCVCAESLQFCSTLCDPVGCSPSGCSLHGILEARILEWDWNGLHALLQGHHDPGLNPSFPSLLHWTGGFFTH